jgi:amphi-Trp domain-containing protein
MKVEQKQALSRQEAARFLAALAQELEQDGRVTVALGSSTLEFAVASQLDCELEVSVDGGQLELELELKWSLADPSDAAQAAAEQTTEVSAVRESAAAEPAEDQTGGESANVTPAENASAEVTSVAAELAETESVEADSAERESEQDFPNDGDSPDAPAGDEAASAGDEAQESATPEAAAGSAEAEADQAAEPSRSAKPRRARRSASASADKSTFNGVDQAAVRAWAAANGLTVSPRGRIKAEVVQAYRAAGN